MATAAVSVENDILEYLASELATATGETVTTNTFGKLPPKVPFYGIDLEGWNPRTTDNTALRVRLLIVAGIQGTGKVNVHASRLFGMARRFADVWLYGDGVGYEASEIKVLDISSRQYVGHEIKGYYRGDELHPL